MTEEEYRANVLKTLNLIAEQTKPQKSTEPASEKHPAETFLDQKKESAIEHIDVCPTCRTQFKEKLRPEILKEQREQFKKLKSPKLCEDCGEILDGQENKDCPNCHGRNY